MEETWEPGFGGPMGFHGMARTSYVARGCPGSAFRCPVLLRVSYTADLSVAVWRMFRAD